MKRELILCDGCGVILHAENWYHDNEICKDCGSGLPLNHNSLEINDDGESPRILVGGKKKGLSGANEQSLGSL